MVGRATKDLVVRNMIECVCACARVRVLVPRYWGLWAVNQAYDEGCKCMTCLLLVVTTAALLRLQSNGGFLYESAARFFLQARVSITSRTRKIGFVNTSAGAAEALPAASFCYNKACLWCFVTIELV